MSDEIINSLLRLGEDHPPDLDSARVMDEGKPKADASKPNSAPTAPDTAKPNPKSSGDQQQLSELLTDPWAAEYASQAIAGQAAAPYMASFAKGVVHEATEHPLKALGTVATGIGAGLVLPELVAGAGVAGVATAATVAVGGIAYEGYQGVKQITRIVTAPTDAESQKATEGLGGEFTDLVLGTIAGTSGVRLATGVAAAAKDIAPIIATKIGNALGVRETQMAVQMAGSTSGKEVLPAATITSGPSPEAANSQGTVMHTQSSRIEGGAKAEASEVSPAASKGRRTSTELDRALPMIIDLMKQNPEWSVPRALKAYIEQHPQDHGKFTEYAVYKRLAALKSDSGGKTVVVPGRRFQHPTLDTAMPQIIDLLDKHPSWGIERAVTEYLAEHPEDRETFSLSGVKQRLAKLEERKEPGPRRTRRNEALDEAMPEISELNKQHPDWGVRRLMTEYVRLHPEHEGKFSTFAIDHRLRKLESESTATAASAPELQVLNESFAKYGELQTISPGTAHITPETVSPQAVPWAASESDKIKLTFAQAGNDNRSIEAYVREQYNALGDREKQLADALVQRLKMGNPGRGAHDVGDGIWELRGYGGRGGNPVRIYYRPQFYNTGQGYSGSAELEGISTKDNQGQVLADIRTRMREQQHNR